MIMRYAGIRAVASIVFVVVLGGCATSKPIPLSNDTYMISQTSAGGMFKSMSSLKNEVITRANAFAASKGKVAIPIASKESPAYPGHMPNFEYQFRLVDKNDPRASGAALVPRPDMVIQNTGTTTADIEMKNVSSNDVYAELMKLDDLRKKGIITEEEFQDQKRRVLYREKD
jgi:hypothetical protein